MGVTKVTLRKRLLPSGKITLYLDFYPPLRDPHSRKYVRHEYLGIYLVNKPRFQSDKDANKEKIAQAEAIRSERELAIIRGQYDFLDKTKLKMDFLAYFKTKLDTKDQKWIRVYDHFSNYCGGVCKMGDITVPFCEGFREYLLNAKQLKHPDKQLAQNSAAGYWSTFRGFLKIAYQEKLLQENVNDYLETIDAVDGRREFLTLEEVRQLAATPCDTPDLKNASLFSCLTGLRISDILALNWSNIVKATDGGWCIRIKTEKTDTEATLPLSQEAYELCGKPGTGLVFKNLKRHYTQKPLQDWLKDAGITKHITFHCFRHTFATLQVNEGTDIYTVSHLLTLPLSQEAYELCGTPGTGLVFKDLKRHYTQKPLQDWLKDAGITKHITFHCFRHTFATLQVNEGTDIYTVSHLLTHANVGTTQIYADIVDKSKRDAVERIKIKKEE